MFNEGGYLQLADNGILREVIADSRHASRVSNVNAPHCTESQLVRYIDNDGNEVAAVHQYLQPDGELWASGLPDPKRLFHDGVRYHLETTRPRSVL